MLSEIEFCAAHKAYYKVLCQFAYSYLLDIEKCRDFVSGVFLTLWEERERYQNITVKAFLYKCIKNRCINECRHMKYVHEHQKISGYEINEESEQRMSEQQAIKLEMFSLLYKAIEELPKQRKKIILLWIKGEEKKTGLELAEIMNLSPFTIKEHKTKAYKALRQFILPKWKEIF